MLSTMPQKRPPKPKLDNYEVSPELVAEAMLRRLTELPEERAAYRDALINSLEVIESPELDWASVRAEKLQQRLF